MTAGIRLRTLGLGLMIVAFCAGLGSAGVWFWSTLSWERHLAASDAIGIAIFEALRTGAPMPDGVTAQRLPPDQSGLASQGDFARMDDLPTPPLVTNMSILDARADPLGGATLSLGIVTDSIRYSVSRLASEPGQSSAEKFGNVTRMMATYCSQSVLFARLGDGAWRRIEGDAIWGCDATPRDMRLAAVIAAGLALAIMGTLVADTSAHFGRFARALRDRRRLGGPESYSTKGPNELRDIVDAVNTYLEGERAQLSHRAMVLSGISHDLGTPATRLRLRTALIKEPDLRDKLEADIDKMTSMIESVLSYTHAELNAEEPRKVSLTSLIEAMVDDYRDMGKPVSMRRVAGAQVQGGRSVFTGHAGHGAIPERQRILITARPIALQRAVSNLIDNALKYGRRATVEVRATSSHATIFVEDEGSALSPGEVEAAIAPFQRGTNTTSISGSGLGLTIVATVAEQHGGELRFDTCDTGLRAILTISRS